MMPRWTFSMLVLSKLHWLQCKNRRRNASLLGFTIREVSVPFVMSQRADIQNTKRHCLIKMLTGGLLNYVAFLGLPSLAMHFPTLFRKLHRLSARKSSCKHSSCSSCSSFSSKAVSLKVTYVQLSGSPQSCASQKCNMSLSSAAPMICS